MSGKDSALIAYEIHPKHGMPIVPAPIEREWMEETDARFAYRCLPLVVANQAGWFVQCPLAFSVKWNGGSRLEDLCIRYPRGRRDRRILSHFGCGVLTFSLPYLFRTPPGINLWVKGPSNWIKDGIQPLEGVVESDWSPATFTMNWRMTRPNHSVRFKAGEPICMVVPIPRGLAEGLEPQRLPLANNKQLRAQYGVWKRARGSFLNDLIRGQSDAIRRGWQKDYFLGLAPDGRRFEEHQTRLHLKEFAKG
jgi:uncharacterized protein DUF6065